MDLSGFYEGSNNVSSIFNRRRHSDTPAIIFYCNLIGRRSSLYSCLDKCVRPIRCRTSFRNDEKVFLRMGWLGYCLPVYSTLDYFCAWKAITKSMSFISALGIRTFYHCWACVFIPIWTSSIVIQEKVWNFARFLPHCSQELTRLFIRIVELISSSSLLTVISYSDLLMAHVQRSTVILSMTLRFSSHASLFIAGQDIQMSTLFLFLSLDLLESLLIQEELSVSMNLPNNEKNISSSEQKIELDCLHFFHRAVQERDRVLLLDGWTSAGVSSIPTQDWTLGWTISTSECVSHRKYLGLL